MFYTLDTLYNKVFGMHTNGIDPNAFDDTSNFGIRITDKVKQDYVDWINNNL